MENENKIRKLLGNEYHLSIHYKSDMNNYRWVLFKKYDDTKIYFSEDNEPIMSSETNTIDELYEYAKKHHKIDEHFTILKSSIFVACINLFVIVINIIFFNNQFIRGFIWGVDFVIILNSIILHIIWEHNWKVRQEILKENILKLRRMHNEL